MLVNRKEKDLLWQNMECSYTFKHTEYFLELWTTFTHYTDETGGSVHYTPQEIYTPCPLY
jgi:hypothetical protein